MCRVRELWRQVNHLSGDFDPDDSQALARYELCLRALADGLIGLMRGSDHDVLFLYAPQPDGDAMSQIARLSRLVEDIIAEGMVRP
jgi:hypothetical protein